MLDQVGRRVQSFITISRYLEIMRGCRARAQFNSAEMPACEYRRIHKCRQGNALEIYRVSICPGHRKSGSEFPVLGQPKLNRDLDVITRHPTGIKHHLV